jgi:hypothetical protein
MITFQFPVNFNVCENEKAVDDNTIADKEANIKEVLKLAYFII